MLRHYSLEGGVLVVELQGTLDATNSPLVREAVLAAAAGAPRVVVDMAPVERVFSSGLSALIAIHKEAEAAGSVVVFCGLRPFLREILRITMLDRIFRTAGDLDQALELLHQSVQG